MKIKEETIMKIRKALTALISAAFITAAFAGCGSAAGGDTEKTTTTAKTEAAFWAMWAHALQA